MILIACDPGVAKDSAFAVFNLGRLVETYKTNELWELANRFRLSEKLIMEDQYLGINTKTLKDLTRQSGRIIGMAEYQDNEVELVMPISWQSYFKVPRRPKGITQYKWKKQHALDIIEKAEKLTGWKFTGDDDTASAVLIGLWGIEHE